MIATAPEPVIPEAFSAMAHFTPAQLRALEASNQHQYVLFGGCRGPGKSYWLRWMLLREVLRLSGQLGEPVAVGIFCEDYPRLTDRQVSKIAVEWPGWLGELRTTKIHGFGFYLRPEYGSGVICLRNLDDASKYQSSEFAAIGVDELTRNEKATWDQLRGSLRWPRVSHPRFIASANPGGIGHGWVRQLWIERSFPPELRPIADEFCFVPALPDDNPHLSESYWDMLNTLPSDLARAWRYGDWDVFAGQFFTTWRAEQHVIPDMPIPAHWKLFGSVDYGFHPRAEGEKPFSYGVYATDETGRVYRIAELAAAEWDVERQKREIATLEKRWTQPVQDRIGCPSMFTSQQHTGPTIAEMYADQTAGVRLPVRRADTDQVNGWARCRQWLNLAPDGKPWFQSFESCRQFNAQIPLLIYDENNPDLIDDRCEDHCLIGSTLVETSLGAVPIRDIVGTTGFVHTPKGLRPYRAVRMTRPTQETLRLVTTTGLSVTATPDHRVMLADGEWREMQYLRTGDKLLYCAGLSARPRDILSYSHIKEWPNGRVCHQFDGSELQWSPLLSLRCLLSAFRKTLASSSVGVSQRPDCDRLAHSPYRQRPSEQPVSEPSSRERVGSYNPASCDARAAGYGADRASEICPSGSREMAQERGRAGRASSQLRDVCSASALTALYKAVRMVRAGLLSVANYAFPRPVLLGQLQGCVAAKDWSGQSYSNLSDMRRGVYQREVRRHSVLQSDVWLGAPATVANVTHATIEDVYCLEVEDDQHSFCVNGGLVVSNCAEEWRHFLMSRPEPAHIEPTRPERGSAAEMFDKRRNARRF